jgi:hypothetical protein
MEAKFSHVKKLTDDITVLAKFKEVDAVHVFFSYA